MVHPCCPGVREPEVIKLPDGRRMAVHHFGDPGGVPLLFFHGWPSDATMAALLDDAAKKHGFRVIAPDRPGVGRSDAQAGRNFLSWSADVRALTEHLGISRFSMLGVSGGGPYTFAIAHTMPERVTAAAVVCGAPPLDDPQDRRMLPWIYRALLFARSLCPGLLRIAFRLGGPLIPLLPAGLFRLATRPLLARGHTAMRDPRNFAIIFDGMRGSWAAGHDGVHDDAVLYAAPWGFDPAQSRLAVDFWHGALDANFPEAIIRRFAMRTPSLRLHIVPNEDHYSLPFTKADAILEALATRVATSAGTV